MKSAYEKIKRGKPSYFLKQNQYFGEYIEVEKQKFYVGLARPSSAGRKQQVLLQQNEPTMKHMTFFCKSLFLYTC